MKEIFTLIVLVAQASFTFCQSDYKHKSITVFKDGTVFIEKSTTIEVNNNLATLKTLPFAISADKEGTYNYRYGNEAAEISKRLILGTLKFTAPNNSIEEISLDSSIIVSNKETPYRSIMELLEYNIGKKIKIMYADIQSPITGEIQKLLIERVIIQNTEHYVDKLIIQNKNSLYFIELGKIINIEFIDTPILTKSLKEEINNKTIHLKLNKNTKNQLINISYLQKGIFWIPTYFIDIEENGRGILKLEANLINDIEDVEEAEFNFAVGVPSFQFSYVNSPLSTDKDVLQILANLNNPPKESETSIQNIMSQSGNYNKVNYNTNYTPQIEGLGEEDLFFYKKQKLSIANGGRLIVPLFEIPITYQDIYSVQLQPNSQERSSAQQKENTVWHSLKFKNTAGFPLTTGTVFFKKLNGNEIAVLSQNQFNYTPSNEFSIVEMTVSPDIWVQNSDNEIERKSVGSDNLLTIEGVIDIVNYKSKSITLLINREIKGELLMSDKNWTTKAGFYTNRNKINTVSWNLEVPAGKAEKIKYSYTILVD